MMLLVILLVLSLIGRVIAMVEEYNRESAEKRSSQVTQEDDVECRIVYLYPKNPVTSERTFAREVREARRITRIKEPHEEVYDFKREFHKWVRNNREYDRLKTRIA